MLRHGGLLLILILAALADGCVTYNRFTPASVESATLSIQTVRYGTMRVGSGKIENTLYVKRGSFHTANASTSVFRLDGNKNTSAEISPMYAKRKQLHK